MTDTIFPLQIWPEGIAQASVPANENSLRNEALRRPCLGFENDVADPADGDLYIVGSAPTGAFATFSENDLAFARVTDDGTTWHAWAPTGGLIVWMDDGSQRTYVAESTNEWEDSSPAGMLNPMTTAGDIIVGGVSGAPTRLPIGTSGQVLGVVGGALAYTSGGGGGGAMTLVASETVSGSAQTTVTLSSLDLAADGCYMILFSIQNVVASTATYSMFFNGDTTATNYQNQPIVGAGATISGGRANNGRIAEVAASSYVTGEIKIQRDVSGRPRSICWANRDEPASIVMQGIAHVRANTANVTSITFSSSVASSIGIGSSFKVFKIN